MRSRELLLLLMVSLLFTASVVAQSPNGTINGFVLDPSGKPIAEAEITIVGDATGVQYAGKTNDEGIYVVTNLPPGPYRLQVSKVGFKTLIKPDITLNVQDALAINFTLPIGAVSETITVEGGAAMIDTQDGTVSTVVDRQFAENLPMNGRSFQTLIQLTPGVVLTTSNGDDSGQFSVNGQRASSNYWMVDGVSANVGGTAYFGGDGLAGATNTLSVLGGTNSLVSVDALQEFRIQTSTYAPEFGRTPGGQISIVTRSGSNQFHGTAFDYLRNDVFDAKDWFDGYTNDPPLPKARERQNDFGGTFSGPILRDKTFFFFSYEGLRLELPETALTTVPDLNARRNASPALQPFLNAYPFDPAQPDLGNGIAQFNRSFSNPASLDAYSIRVDHKLNQALQLFARYNYSPSAIVQRGSGGTPLSVVSPARIATQTATAGAIWIISPTITNDLRFNYSSTNSSSRYSLDNFGGAVPLSSLPLPGAYTSQNAELVFNIFTLTNGSYSEGRNVSTDQRQVNLVDNLSVQKGPHSLKFGVDFRRLSPVYAPHLYSQLVGFQNVASAETGAATLGSIGSDAAATLLFRNLGIFAQDTWRVFPRLTMTYGLRWDLDLSPSSIQGPILPGVTGFNLNDLSQLALAPAGTPPFKTFYGNFAPRVGIAYQFSQLPDWGTVIRGGFGIFYDLASSEAGNLILEAGYPFTARSNCPNSSNPACPGGSLSFPFNSAVAAPPLIVPPSATSPGTLAAFDPNLELPYTLEWNVALEQALGRQQSLSASYVGSVGRRLIQSADVFSPNPNLAQAVLVSNGTSSSYNALQLQFQRRLSGGFQALASYTWSHSIDDASAGSLGSLSNAGVPTINPEVNRGPSDFDIRNAFSTGLTYEIPIPRMNSLANAIGGHWSAESVIQVRSAPPVNVFNTLYGFDELLSGLSQVRPDVIPGIPFYLYGPQDPGGKAINPAAFTAPPSDSFGDPLRQGDLGRNALRGFGATQWDFAVHREFAIHEALRLQFRAEIFNLLNHPNFGHPDPDLLDPTFGQATQMLGQSLNGNNLGGGAFSPLYQIGGPRSMQFSLKLMF
ncbi:MAG: TonB-dependent receptor [Candidatus Acidiferrales bacterium]